MPWPLAQAHSVSEHPPMTPHVPPPLPVSLLGARELAVASPPTGLGSWVVLSTGHSELTVVSCPRGFACFGSTEVPVRISQ